MILNKAKIVVFIYLYSINLILSIYVDKDSKFSDERGNFTATDFYFMRKTVFLENIISILHAISVVIYIKFTDFRIVVIDM